MIIWIVGISGSGKTTVGNLLADKIRSRVPNLVFLDGDLLREVWGDNLGHDVDARAMNSHRFCYLCRMLDQQNQHVVAAILSIFPHWQKWNRENFSKYFEVFLDVPIEVARRRDTKDIYDRALRGELRNVVGVDIPFPKPPNPDLTFSVPDVLEKPERIAGKIFSRIENAL